MAYTICKKPKALVHLTFNEDYTGASLLSADTEKGEATIHMTYDEARQLALDLSMLVEQFEKIEATVPQLELPTLSRGH